MIGRSVDELNTDYYFTSWSGLICALQTVALSGTVLLLPLNSFSENLGGKFISTLGGYTFYIYLIHYVFTNHFRATGLEAAFKAFFGETSLGLMLYSLIYSLFVFAFCSILIFIFRQLTKLISTVLRYKK